MKVEEAMVTLDLISHLHRQKKWSLRTFGPGDRTEGVIDHIKKELVEIQQAKPGDDLDEWMDVVILAFDGAWRLGYSPETIALALLKKQHKNELRQWPPLSEQSPGKATEHVREDGE